MNENSTLTHFYVSGDIAVRRDEIAEWRRKVDVIAAGIQDNLVKEAGKKKN